MVLLNILRMIADVAFYGAFAGFVAAKFDGSGALLGAVIQSICFGLSWLGGRRRWLRLVLLLPMVSLWFLYGENLADCIMLAPTTIYIFWLAWRADYPLQYERQSQLFQTFWKILTVAAVLLVSWESVTGGTGAVSVLLPYGVLMMVASVLLMRTLRHDREVYLQPQYQLVNYSIIGTFLLIAAFLSSKAFLNSCLAVLRFLYKLLLKPVLQVFLKVLEGAIWLLFQIFALIVRPEAFNMTEDALKIDMGGGSNDPILEALELEGMEQGHFPWELLGWCLLAVGVFIFFRWLKRRSKEVPASEDFLEIREDEPSRPLLRRTLFSRKAETSETHKIRSQYKSFLKWCAKQGVPAKATTTSLEMHRRISEPTGCEATSAEIRELYIRARYAGRADQEGTRRMKKLCAQIRRETKEAADAENT